MKSLPVKGAAAHRSNSYSQVAHNNYYNNNYYGLEGFVGGGLLSIPEKAP